MSTDGTVEVTGVTGMAVHAAAVNATVRASAAMVILRRTVCMTGVNQPEPDSFPARRNFYFSSNTMIVPE